MKTRLTYCDALNLAIRREMLANEKVIVFGLDVTDHKAIFGSTRGLLEEFGPERIFITPLSEDAMTGTALGLALSGFRPVHVHIRGDFMLLGMNQIANMISNMRYLSGGKLKVPLVIRAVMGRGWGQGAQHSKSVHALFSHLPGLKVVLPTTPQDAYSLLRSSIWDDNPVIFIEHRWLYYAEAEIDDELVVPIGASNILREGNDATLIATSWMNVEGLRAAEILARRHGISLEVLDARTASPLDIERIVRSVDKTRVCVVADYDWMFCGLSAEIAAVVHKHCFSSLRLPVERLGFAPVPCPTTRPLENLFYPSAKDIIRVVERLLNLSKIDLTNEQFFSYESKFTGPF